MTGLVQFPLSDLGDGRAKGFKVNGKAAWFAVRKGDRVFAYLDRCPHYGRSALAWRQDEYLDQDQGEIRCAGHNALFDVETGEGTAGACLGQRLLALPVTVSGGIVTVDVSLLVPA